ncbi:MAG: DUF342 domain-containing protein [Desulfovibrionaceae bacterium]|jgi:uncharacterized protein (DUF342 family)|nr:DUF342 domain-containing protein [Desulfovibrionaceae bacterium]
MRPHIVTVTAASQEEALAQAVGLLQAPPAEVEHVAHDEGRHTVRLKRCDAAMLVSISEDKMLAILDAEPAFGEGGDFDPKALVGTVREAGIRVQIDAAALKEAMNELLAGRAVHDLVVAHGTPPTPAQDARIDPAGDWRYPFFPGEAIGVLVPSTPAKPGVYVDGSKAPPEGKTRGDAIIFPDDAFCHLDKISNYVRAERYGLATLNGLELSVTPLGAVSADRMEVRATLFHRDAMGRLIDPDRIQEALAAEDVSERVNAGAVVTAVEEAAQKEFPVKDVLVCRGVLPRHGQDGRFEMVFQDDRSTVGSTTEDGRMDFRSRGMIRSVQKNELLGRLIPPTTGRPGRDVQGRIIPARDGDPYPLVVGENVTTSEEGDEFRAEDVGMVFFVDGLLSVTDVFQTEGDVDMKIGNISLEKGSVHVRGSILSGFTVSSPRHVLVDDVIESACIEAGGDVEVKGGILMERGGKITAAGRVSAMFAQNARIEAQGDVIVHHELNNCVVFTRTKVICTRGKGKIVGSTIRAGEGVDAKEIGSPLGVETTVLLGLERKANSEDLKRRKELKLLLQKIFAAIGSGDVKEILTRTLPAKRKAVADLLKARINAEQELADLEARIEQDRDDMRKAAKARIRVHGTLYPGTTISCFGSTLKIKDPVPHSIIFYNPRTNKVEIGTL